jgi:hypothetical protein
MVVPCSKIPERSVEVGIQVNIRNGSALIINT